MDSSIAFFMGRGRFKRSHCYRVYCQLRKFLCIYCPDSKNRIPHQAPVLVCRLFFCDLAQCCFFLFFLLGAL